MAKASAAPKKATATKAAPKPKAAAAAPAALKPVKETLNKTGLVAYLVEASGVEPKGVKKVMEALENAIAASVSKKGAGSFVLPGYLKITAVKVPAKPKRKGINRFTGQEQVFAAKPASLKIRVRPLKKLKDAVA
jgi:nucleoid DNA-binding protein